MLAKHLDALETLHVHEPQTHETTGTLLGAGILGSFHEWAQGDKTRRDDSFGIRTERILRVGDRTWQQNANGEIRELQGIIARRQITEDFIDSGAFAHHPEAVRFVDRETLSDGRNIYVLAVVPPNGEPYRVGLDAETWLVDEEAFVNGDSMQTTTYSDYKVVDGLLIPYTEVDSDGTHAFDITSHITTVVVNKPIAPSIFAPLGSSMVANTAPVVVPYEVHGGLMFVESDDRWEALHVSRGLRCASRRLRRFARVDARSASTRYRGDSGHRTDDKSRRCRSTADHARRRDLSDAHGDRFEAATIFGDQR